MLFVIVSGINQYSPQVVMFQVMQKQKQKACFTENFSHACELKAVFIATSGL